MKRINQPLSPFLDDELFATQEIDVARPTQLGLHQMDDATVLESADWDWAEIDEEYDAEDYFDDEEFGKTDSDDAELDDEFGDTEFDGEFDDEFGDTEFDEDVSHEAPDSAHAEYLRADHSDHEAGTAFAQEMFVHDADELTDEEYGFADDELDGLEIEDYIDADSFLNEEEVKWLDGELFTDEAPAVESIFFMNPIARSTSVNATLRKRIVQLANAEWERFGRGTKNEKDKVMAKRIQTYFFEGVGIKRFGRKRKPISISILQNNKLAWSAAFISYIMRMAGAGDTFRYAALHTRYIAAAKQANLKMDSSKFQAFDITAVKPEIGDLVCRDRRPKRGEPCNGTNLGNVDKGGISHCDIVVEVHASYIVILGGNTSQRFPKKGEGSNTVGKRKLKLNAQGFVDLNIRGCKYFAIMKPPDFQTGRSSTPRDAMPITSLPKWVEKIVRSGVLTLQAAQAIHSGQRDINTLTNMIFYARHPNLPVGYKIQSHQAGLQSSWRHIRDDVIRPILRKLEQDASSTRQPSKPAASQGIKPNTDSLQKITPDSYRKFRLTTYHVVDQKDYPIGTIRIPIYDEQKNKIAEGSPKFFAKLALEGTAFLSDGRLINVTGKKVPVSHDEYASVLTYHNRAYEKRNRRNHQKGKNPVPTAYSGIIVQNNRVKRAAAFHLISGYARGVGYGRQRKKIPMIPFRTLAADTGRMRRSDKKWKGQGGLVPVGTKVYIKEYDGLKLPNHDREGYFIHDGWFTVNDTGGAIFGAHFDVFVGTRSLREKAGQLPAFSQVWFNGIHLRMPEGYNYGLRK